MAPALDHATTLPSVSAIVMSVLLNDAWMCTMPWWTTRFSRFFLNVFYRLGFRLLGVGIDPSIVSSFAIRQQSFLDRPEN